MLGPSKQYFQHPMDHQENTVLKRRINLSTRYLVILGKTLDRSLFFQKVYVLRPFLAPKTTF